MHHGSHRLAIALCVTLTALGASTGAGHAAPDAATLALMSKDVPGASDHPLAGRYQGSALLAQTVKAFDEIVLPSGAATGFSFSSDKKFSATVTARGKITRAIYVAPLGRSTLEVVINFEEFVAAKGFEPVFKCVRDACGESFPILKYHWDRPESKVLGQNYENIRKLTIDAVFDQLADWRYTLFKKSAPEGDSYVAIYGGRNQNGSFGDFSAALSDRVSVLVEVVEPKALDRRMEVVNAAQIGGKLAAEGRAVFYGIQFDFDKADIKAESEPQLAEMAKFLLASAALNAFVVGHTDGQGMLDYNLTLSGKRADAVVQALVKKYAVPAARLTARGLGPLAPVATNRDEDGRAKNRRVELVERP